MQPQIIYRKSDSAPFVIQEDGRYVLDYKTWIGSDAAFTTRSYSLESLQDPRYFSEKLEECTTLEEYHKNTYLGGGF